MFARIAALGCVVIAAACTPTWDGKNLQPLLPPPQIGTEQAFRDACEAWDDWRKPADPFRIAGNTWYVGSCGIAAILIASDEGHVLIDTGEETHWHRLLSNIGATGHDVTDVQYVGLSHEHYDHVGAHQSVLGATGATAVAPAAARAVLETGKPSDRDPQAGVLPNMRAIAVGRTIRDGDTLSIGSTRITAHLTPGHTMGAVSWSWWVKSAPGEPPVARHIVYADSLSPVSRKGYRFSDHPERIAAFRASFDKIAAIAPCDILLTPHPAAAGEGWPVVEREPGQPSPCAAYAEKGRQRLDARLASEAANGEGDARDGG